MNKQNYMFPLLKTQEICECINDLDLGFKLADEELLKPNPQRIFSLYEAIVVLFTSQQIKRDDLQFTLIEILEHPDLHRESIDMMSLFKLLLKLLPHVGIHDFGLHDLIRPEPNRLKRILSGLINFAKFREDRLLVFDQCTMKGDEATERANSITKKNQSLSEKVNVLRLRRVEQEPQVNMIKEKNLRLTETLIGLQKTQKGLNVDVEKLKEVKLEMEGKLTNLNLSITSSSQEMERIKSRIVHNPQMLKDAIKDMSSNVQSTRKFCGELEQKYRLMLTKLEMMVSVDQDINSCIKIMEESKQDVRLIEELTLQNGIQKENLASEQQISRDLAVKHQQASRQLSKWQERMDRLVHQQTKKQSEIEETLATLKEEYQLINQERRLVEAKVDTNQAYINELQAKINDLERASELETEMIEGHIAGLIERFEAGVSIFAQ